MPPRKRGSHDSSTLFESRSDKKTEDHELQPVSSRTRSRRSLPPNCAQQSVAAKGSAEKGSAKSRKSLPGKKTNFQSAEETLNSSHKNGSGCISKRLNNTRNNRKKNTAGIVPGPSKSKVLTSTEPPSSSKKESTPKDGTLNSMGSSVLREESPMDVDNGFVMVSHTAATSSAADSHVSSSLQAGAEEETCAVCMCPPENPKVLDKCKHKFCTPCIDQCFAKINPQCPVCGEVYGDMTGNMPPGSMTTFVDSGTHLPGYMGYGTIIITYSFANGTQTEHHPHPGKPYYGTYRTAFLPNNAEGQKVCQLLRRAFDAKMTFTVGRSATTGLDDQVIWNDVHHKTRIHGGPTSFGYPDDTYLNRVQEELAAKGIK